MNDMLSDPKASFAAAIQAQRKWATVHALQVRDATRDLYSLVAEGLTAVARSQVLLDELNARKPSGLP